MIRYFLIALMIFSCVCTSDKETPPKYITVRYLLTCIDGVEYIATFGASKGLTPHLNIDGTIILCSDNK